MSGVVLRLEAGAMPDVEEVILDAPGGLSVDVLVELVRLLRPLDPDAVLSTDAPDGVVRFVLRVDRRALRRRQRRRSSRSS